MRGLYEDVGQALDLRTTSLVRSQSSALTSLPSVPSQTSTMPSKAWPAGLSKTVHGGQSYFLAGQSASSMHSQPHASVGRTDSQSSNTAASVQQPQSLREYALRGAAGALPSTSLYACTPHDSAPSVEALIANGKNHRTASQALEEIVLILPNTGGSSHHPKWSAAATGGQQGSRRTGGGASWHGGGAVRSGGASWHAGGAFHARKPSGLEGGSGGVGAAPGPSQSQGRAVTATMLQSAGVGRAAGKFPGREEGSGEEQEGEDSFKAVVLELDMLQEPLQQRSTYAQHSIRAWVFNYFRKWQGVPGQHPPPRDSLWHIAWTWIGSFLSILAIAVVQQNVSPNIDLPVLVASFGAAAVLVFGVPDAKLSQPRNFVGGQMLSALVGVSIRAAIPDHMVWLSAPLGMATAVLVMQVTQTTHPPGGATALVAASVTTIGPWYGFKFLITVAFACAIMLSMALVINNMSNHRRYPLFWY